MEKIINETWEQKREREGRDARACLEKLKAVAKTLNYKIVREPEPEDVFYNPGISIEGPGEIRLYLHGEGYRTEGRIEISGSFPQWDNQEIIYQSERNEAGLVSITVAGTKTPEQIAGDITRRYLPKYLEVLAKAKERRDLWQKGRDSRKGYFEQIAGRKPETEDEERRGKFHLPYTHGEPCGDITVDQDGNCEMKLDNVPVAVAVKILKMVRG